MNKVAGIIAMMVASFVAMNDQAFAQVAPVEAAASTSMSKSEICVALADKTGLTKTQVQSVLDELALLSYKEAANGFSIPGIGKLVLVDRAARVGRNPATGETIQIPAKKAIKFRIAKACKDAILK